MIAHPFIIVPWSDNFAASLHRSIIALTEGRPEAALVVFPNKRPRRYLIDEFARNTADGKTTLLPGVMDIGEFIRLCLQECGESPKSHVSALDAAAILMECLQTCAEEAAGLPDIADLRKLAGSVRLFYPWGVKLAALLDECDANLVDYEQLSREALPPDAFGSPDEDLAGRSWCVTDMLLSNIRIIARLWHEKMRSHGFSSPGLDSRRAARLIEKRGVPHSLEGKTIIFAGFVRLNKSENALLHRFWQENGAWICLRSDPGILSSRGHWSCGDHEEWLGEWKADATSFDEWLRRWLDQDAGREKFFGEWFRNGAAGGGHAGTAGKDRAKVKFFAGYDLHSQLARLSSALNEEFKEDDERRKNNGTGQDRHDPPPTTAIVLSHDSLLTPVLSALPAGAGGKAPRINISLGYPLGRLPIAQLVERVLQANETADASGRLHWKELRAVFRHPSLRLLTLFDNPGSESEGDPLVNPPPNAGQCLQRLERHLRSNERMIDPQALKAGLQDEALRKKIFQPGKDDEPIAYEKQAACFLAGYKKPGSTAVSSIDSEEQPGLIDAVTGWQEAKTLRELGKRLQDFLGFILEHGREGLRHSPRDSKCLAVLMQSVLPALTESLLADKDLGGQAADAESMPFAILRQQIAAQRVPFESSPEEDRNEDGEEEENDEQERDGRESAPSRSLQVLGMLETRLLQFDRVHVLDLTEDALPGEPRRDPLLPDALRRAKGIDLPESRHRDRLAAHTFHSLLAGTAKEACLYWQEGVQSGMVDKKIRSRFVEEKLWECEKREKKLLKRFNEAESPLRKARFMVPQPQSETGRPIGKTPEIDARLWDHLTMHGISASSINSYLHCPRQFFLQALCGLKAPADPGDEEDPSRTGTLIHDFLYGFFWEFKEKHGSITGHTDRTDLGEKLTRAFFDLMEGKDPFPEQKTPGGIAALVADLPPHTYFFLKEAAPRRLQKYVSAMPAGEILHLEMDLSCRFPFNGKDVLLRGRSDRIDLREGRLTILDYKTGSIDRHLPDAGFWDDSDLWERMEEWKPGCDDDPLADLAESLKSIQLPLYLLLAKSTEDKRINQYPAGNAALVELKDSCGEKALFQDDDTQEVRDAILEKKIPSLLRFILRHMTESKAFAWAHDDNTCAYCPFAASCGRSA